MVDRMTVIADLYRLQDTLTDPEATPVKKVGAAQQHVAALIRSLHEAELKDRDMTA